MRTMNTEETSVGFYMCVKQQTNRVRRAYGRRLAIYSDNIPQAVSKMILSYPTNKSGQRHTIRS